ncbi:MAG TPA: sugar ABC transporter permease [Candidatus Sumerlaeota bacterium]|nr:MAG: Lactose transport system permease protein LacF [candidate division BRC1 bacterium ADurb.BinA292]HOE95667.1 sugar ABC transporter permease [Candidatus Sumerlaeota bacterium]HOR27392.1 sugar ABC transporter permease [Candidatus Sumerlaeota bacterium]HPK01945.1 sugar ABC transporter permease [Candidatus Sumerlaeota bacterium]
MRTAAKLRLRNGLLFISPWLLGFALFVVYPVGATFYYSFCDYDVLSHPVWLGLQNYRDMLTDTVLWQALGNTLLYAAVSLPLGLALSLGLALLLNQPIVLRPLFRTIFFLPSLVPAVALAMLWLWMFNGQFGLLNIALETFGIKGPIWLGDPAWTKPALVIMSLWGVGGGMIITLAALQEVPRELYESAEIDGARARHKLWHITLPMISPVLYFNLIMGLIGVMQIFAQPYIMFGGNGGPSRSALFYAVYLYENAFTYNDMGYACAMAWILFLIILGLTLIATRATRRHIYYAGKAK